ncbi:MAG: mandelate racemase/muconate lactonizing enzyme family protein [Gemmatimonadetes bacterium]|jgi:L-alanine-DL-glutamate epimerase-like enolase superfamily enzyme|nr:mandelate racemase/muconate lactonizing enzyme family protein [Gemmatimonadota bacterium]MBT7863086.1 mandelate racemase/muconate lactonizing enzyme family protein [Gemmatimonadota bacterium]
MKITNAKMWALNLPFRNDRVESAMQRANTQGERIYVYRLETEDGSVGYGDSTTASPVGSLPGRPLFGLINDDSIGIGPQIAALDAAGKAAGVPVHALLGEKIRSRVQLSWWAIDMAPADWVAEAEDAAAAGFTSMKLKARPWRDIVDQIGQVGKAVPTDFKLDVDFNGFLLTQAKAEGVLGELDGHPNVGLFESPFYMHTKADAGRLLRERIRTPIVEHFNSRLVAEQVADGTIIGGEASVVRHQAALAAAANQPFFLQFVGTGITAAYVVQLASVLSHAHLPHITCHSLWKHDLLKKPLELCSGFCPVSETPGLGIEVDESAIARYAVDEDESTPQADYRRADRIMRVTWPSGGDTRLWEFTDELYYQAEFYAGSIPGFMRGVDLDVIEDDGSTSFRESHDRVRRGEPSKAAAMAVLNKAHSPI